MADENQMCRWLDKHNEGGRRNVIIFQEGCPADVGQYDYATSEHSGRRYIVYVGARGTWRNRGDGGWVNWAMSGRYDKQDKVVHFQ